MLLLISIRLALIRFFVIVLFSTSRVYEKLPVNFSANKIIVRRDLNEMQYDDYFQKIKHNTHMVGQTTKFSVMKINWSHSRMVFSFYSLFNRRTNKNPCSVFIGSISNRNFSMWTCDDYYWKNILIDAVFFPSMVIKREWKQSNRCM